MAETDERAERSRDVDRVLTYVDAIVAIAVTLLVLPLADSARDLDHFAPSVRFFTTTRARSRRS